MKGTLETTVGGVDVGVDYSLHGQQNPKNGQPMIFYIHGLACSEADFAAGDSENPELRDIKLASFTHPGCDGTEYPRDGHLGVDHLVKAMRDVVTTERLSNIILIGHSIGGIVALRYAAEYPKGIVGVVSVEGNLRDSDCFMTRKIMDGEETRESLAQRFSGSDNPGFRRFASRLMKTDPTALKDYATSAVEHSDRGDLFDIFAGIRVPTLYVCGESNVSDIGYTEELRQHGVQVEVVPGSDHFPDADNPSDYYKIVGSFVERVVLFTRGW